MKNKGQISIEIIILLGIIIIGAILVSIFLLQNVNKSRERIVVEENEEEPEVFNEITAPDKTSGAIGLILSNKVFRASVVFRTRNSGTKAILLR